ncbi:MAG TPA: tetratricopeptide repeat protein [Anaeromyxobacter sp.]|nr:tetratricopeptide repeat protein [Anaeromyxobacter sp.]
MWNLLISLAAGTAVAAAIRFGTEFPWPAALLPGVVAAGATYFLLVRRILKRLERLFEAMQREVQARHVDKAIQTLQAGFSLAPWQFLVAAQIHSNIGILHYLKKDFDAALPHLLKSFTRNWIARGMLAALRYQRKDLAGARKVLDDAVSANRKEGVLWAEYAWILEKENQHEEAIAVLGRGVRANPSDEKLKASLQALQNGKKLKLGKLYEEQWFQFHLEPPPTQLVGPGFRGNRRALYRG